MKGILDLNLSSENKCRLRTWWEQIFKLAYAQGANFIIVLFEFEHYYLEFWKYVRLLLLPLCKWTNPNKFYLGKKPIWVWPVFENIKTKVHLVCIQMSTFTLSDLNKVLTTQGPWFPILPVICPFCSLYTMILLHFCSFIFNRTYFQKWILVHGFTYSPTCCFMCFSDF